MDSKKKNLITTSFDEFDIDAEKNIILGAWCYNIELDKNIDKNSFKVIPYHWDDREKLKKDYKLINLLFEAYLDRFANELNNYHKVNFSKRFWRILIGPWLGSILCIIFDKWY